MTEERCDDKAGEAQRALEAMAQLADDFGLPLGTTIEQVATHARYLQEERAKLSVARSAGEGREPVAWMRERPGNSPEFQSKHWPKMGEWKPVYLATPSSDGTITKHAQIGGTIFHPGIAVQSVIDRAYREYDYQQTPKREAERVAKVDRFREAVSTPQSAKTSMLDEHDEPLRKMMIDYRGSHPAHAENYFQKVVRWVKQQAVRSSFHPATTPIIRAMRPCARHEGIPFTFTAYAESVATYCPHCEAESDSRR